MPNYAAGDVRGACPGLNALANHGYMPRNGVASVRYPTPYQILFIDTLYRFCSMSKELTKFGEWVSKLLPFLQLMAPFLVAILYL